MSPKQKRPWRISFSVSAVLHLMVLIGTVPFSIGKAADFGIQGSQASMEIYMVAAMPGYSSKVPAQKEKSEEKKSADGMKTPAPEKEEEQKSSKRGHRSKVKGDGSSAIPGQSVTTLYSQGSAAIAAKPGRYENEAPHYPALAQELGQEGVVLLHVRVDKKGNPSRVEIKKSSGHPRLDEEAQKTVRKWKFEPGRLGRAAIESEINIPIRFYLDTEGAKS